MLKLLLTISLLASSLHAAEEDVLYDNNKFYDELTGMLFTLGLLVAALLCLSWFVRRMQSTRLQSGNTGSRIKVLEQRQISTKTILYLLHIDNKAILVADSANGVTTLTEFPFSADKLPEESPSLFNKMMRQPPP